ncbi:hypothetical protein L2E82_20993 [Cichorium intybus]|uniref:Uncharacterized protein n=1 Tax=Cichorium intybus TaxID=13427 RepID=A0ACB9DUK1_CICIN|nr:hypothetical protein L2E82_20993 [Cichorium intybus]
MEKRICHTYVDTRKLQNVLIHLELRTKDLFSFLLDIAAPAAAAWKTKNLNMRYLFSFSEFRVQVSSPLSRSHRLSAIVR